MAVMREVQLGKASRIGEIISSNALKKPSNFSSVVNALTSLLRDPPAPCTHQILDALAPCLHTLNERSQELAADLVCTLSLHPSNADVLLKSQAVADLAVVLNTGTPHSRARAAEAVYNLVARSDEESSSRRLKIGALGLIRPLLKHFLDLGGRSVVVGPRKTALALWHLASREENVLIMVEIGAVERLVEVVWDERPATAEMRRYALVLMQCAMGSKMGREEFFDVGGMEVLLRRVRRKDCGEGRVGMHCLGVMYRVCRESMRRFREVADDVGAEEVLVEEMEEWGEEGKDWARAMVRVLKGEIQNAEEMKEVQVVMEDEEDGDGRRDAKGKKKVDSE